MTGLVLCRRLFVPALAVAVIGLSGIVAAADAEEKGEEKAEAILERVRAYYRGLDGVAYDMRLYAMQRLEGEAAEKDLRVNVKAQRPNLLAMELYDQTESASEPAFLVRANGERLGVYEVAENRYTRSSASDDILRYPEFQSVMIGSEGLAHTALSLLADDPLEVLLQGVAGTRYEGERTVDDETYQVVRLLTHQGAERLMYVATGEEPYVWQVSFDLGPALAAIRARGQEVEAERFLRFDNHVANPGSSEEAFAFNPPEGARRVLSLAPTHPLQGSQAPTFELERLTGGEVDLASHRGQEVVLLEFWATWCTYCTQMIPRVNEVVERFADREVVFYAVNMRETEARIESFLEDHDMRAEEILLDRDGAVTASYQFQGPPLFAVIDREGGVHWVFHGSSLDLDETLSEAIEQALKKE